MTQNIGRHFIPHLALFTAMVSWASSFIAIKLALNHGYTPAQMMTVRMFSAVVLFLPLCKSVWSAVKNNGHWGALALVLLCEPCLYFLFESQALLYTSASQAGMISAVLPVTVSVVAMIVLHERTSFLGWVGFLLAAGGVVWLTMGADSTETAPFPLLGNTLEGCAMICGALYTVYLKKISTVYKPLHITALQAFVGLLFFAPQNLFDEGNFSQMIDAGTIPLAASVYLGAVVTLAGYGLYNFGVSRINAGQAGAYINLIPVLSLIMGVCILNDVFLPSQYMASVLIFIGICLTQFTQGKGMATS